MTLTSDLPPLSVASYREMLAALPETVIYVVDGSVVELNRPDSQLFLRPAHVGDELPALFDTEPLRLIAGLIDSALRTGSARGEYEYGSSLFTVMATRLPSSPGVMLYFRDVTVRRTAEHTLMELVQGKSTFLTSVGNQLQSPLAAVIGYADLLSQPDPTLDDRARAEMVRDMTDQAWDLAGMIEDLLTMARAELGDLSLVKVPVNLIANVAQVVESMGDRGNHIAVSGGQWITAVGDPARFRQIVRNLLSNAMTHGSEPISILVTSEDSGAVLSVTDHGPGLPAEDERAIFAPSLTTHGSQHHGVGLSISQELASLMRGEITYAREAGVTTFQVWLPLLGS